MTEPALENQSTATTLDTGEREVGDEIYLCVHRQRRMGRGRSLPVDHGTVGRRQNNQLQGPKAAFTEEQEGLSNARVARSQCSNREIEDGFWLWHWHISVLWWALLLNGFSIGGL